MSHINIRCKSIPLQFVCPLLGEQIAICQLQPTDDSRAKYGSPFLNAGHFCWYPRTELNHLPASRRRYPRHLSREAVRYVELDYLDHMSAPAPARRSKPREVWGSFLLAHHLCPFNRSMSCHHRRLGRRYLIEVTRLEPD